MEAVTMNQHLITTNTPAAAALSLLLAARGAIDDTPPGAHPHASPGGTQTSPDGLGQQGTDAAEPMNSSGGSGGDASQ